MFVDNVEVTFQAGDGGDGRVNFRHEKFIDKGGPDGGDGGRGGNIILLASYNQNTLAALRYKKLLKAKDGGAGDKRLRHGKNGEDLQVDVPVGTVVTSGDQILADLTDDGQKVIIARGGDGGFGNAHFTSSTRQTPRVAEKGEKGDLIPATLELKMIADVGIIGLPNAGKSTLLSVVSNARPAIANYPFTTLTPNLGVVDVDGKDSLLLADIPGLIEGASQGKGLGDDFLRHVERTSALLHLVDFYNKDIAAAYKTIIKELHDYKVDLSSRPQIVTLTKIEGAPANQVQAKIKALQKIAPKGTVVVAISSSTGDGVKELLRTLQKQVAADRKKQSKKAARNVLPIIGLKPDPDFWELKIQDDVFVVTGQKIERFAKRTDFGDYHGQQRLRDIMRKMGILREARAKGIVAGQKIHIGDPLIGTIEY